MKVRVARKVLERAFDPDRPLNYRPPTMQRAWGVWAQIAVLRSSRRRRWSRSYRD